MKILRRFLKRLLASATRQGDEERLKEEVEAHIALLTEEYMQGGLSPEEARRQAVLKFGAVESVKEEYRDQKGLPFFESLLHDVRYALRGLRKKPAFTLTVALTLALGIGATTSIFTLVHAVLLKSLPVAKPEQLYRLGKESHCCVRGGYSYQDNEFSIVSYDLYQYFRDHTKGFEELAAFQLGENSFGIRRAHSANSAEIYPGRFVSGNYFKMFGISAYAGRALTASDDQPSAPPVAVMSYRIWEQKYGRDLSVIGGVFNINDKPFTVVGIAPPGFYGEKLSAVTPDFYLPLATEPLVTGDVSVLRNPSLHWLGIIGRVQTGINVSSIEAQMRVELQQWLRSHWSEMDANDRSRLPQQTLYLSPGGAGVTSMRQGYEHWLQILMIVSGFILLIVCANVANLMLVRGLERRQQTSLSMALGARPARMVRQACTESVVLSLLGGAIGIAVAFLGTRLILYFTFERAAVPISAAPSMPVLLFALSISLITGIAFGVAPAWMAMRADPVEALRGANRSTRHAGSLSRKTLVVFQAALSLVLLTTSGLLIQALRNLEHQNFGFEQSGRTVIHVNAVLAGYKPEQLDLLYRRIHDALASMPGVASAAGALYTPLSGDDWSGFGVYIEGKPAPGPNSDHQAGWARVGPRFFETIGNPVLKGRPINEQDTASSRHVAVINEAFARKFFQNEDPIGKRFGKGEMKYAGDYEIVGVAKDARYSSYTLDEPIGAFFFLPASQSTQYSQPMAISAETISHYLRDIVVRMKPGAVLSEAEARRTMAMVDPKLPIVRIRTLSEQVASNFSQQRLMARFTSLFGILALVLASIGIYGITAYNVGSRTNEIGVRMALGADRGSVIALILRGAFLLIGLGLLLGIPLTFAMGRFLGNQLYGLNPYHPMILSIATAALALSAFVASLVPALRASSISPMEALRAE